MVFFSLCVYVISLLRSICARICNNIFSRACPTNTVRACMCACVYVCVCVAQKLTSRNLQDLCGVELYFLLKLLLKRMNSDDVCRKYLSHDISIFEPSSQKKINERE